MRFATVLIGALALGTPGYALAHDHEHGDGHDHGGCSCCRHGDEHHPSTKADSEKPAKAKSAADPKNVAPPAEKSAPPAAKQ